MDEIFKGDARQQLPEEGTCFLQRGAVERRDTRGGVCVQGEREVGVEGAKIILEDEPLPRKKKM